MDEKIILLVMGSVIGLVSSLATRLFDEWLISRRQKKEWEKQRQEKALDEVHDFMNKGLYREVPPSAGQKGLISFILLRGSTIGLLIGFIVLILIIALEQFTQTSPVMILSAAILLFLGWWIGRQVLQSIWKSSS